MPDFSIRSTLPELMDQPGVPEHEIFQALREIEKVNVLLGGYKVMFNALGRLSWPAGTVTIMDMGCGGGDTLRAIARWAKKKKHSVELIGIDWNAAMTQYSARQSTAYPNISFRTLSVFDDRLLEEQADITTCSLFCHHFEKDQLVELVKRMYALAHRAVIINDLHRHWFAYYAIKAITALFSKTYLVKYDGPLSVARALTRKDWQEVLTAAGIPKYTMKWKWAWRWEIIIEKPFRN